MREAQIEPILHFCCRDRNLIGMQADLLACAACGVRNILFVTGDPPKLGDYPHATGVFDADSIGMAAVQKRLNQGVDLGGQSIDPQTFAVIGVGLIPRPWIASARSTVSGRRSSPAPSSPSRSRSSIPTPCCECSMTCSATAFRSWPASGRWSVIATPLFMRNEVPGVVVPDAVMERMAAVTSREDQLAAGIQIARESVARVRDRVAGIQVSAPMGNIETAWAVIKD